jgi:hypothetical protein
MKYWGGQYKCNICGTSVRRFLPFAENLISFAKKHEFVYDFNRMETRSLDNCNYPFCLSNDRERLYAKKNFVKQIEQVGFLLKEYKSDYLPTHKTKRHPSPLIESCMLDINKLICVV